MVTSMLAFHQLVEIVPAINLVLVVLLRHPFLRPLKESR
jgi:hypothetical protein